MTSPEIASSEVPAITSDEEAIAVARAFAAEIAVGASDRDRDRATPREQLEQLGRSGLLGITVPADHGGAEVSCETVAHVFRIMAVADPAVAQIPQNHFAFVANVARAGTGPQKELFLGEALRGARFGNALSERGTKDIFDFRTRLRADGAGTYRLTGRKYYCTGALTADWVPVYALDDADELVIAFVERSATGLEVIDDWSAMGQRGTGSGTTILEDVHVPELHVIRDRGLHRAPATRTAFAQLMLAAIQVGIAENALADAAEFVRTRTRPWVDSGLERASDDPHVLGEFGRAATLLHAAQAMLERAARALDHAIRTGTPAALTESSLAVGEAKAYGGEIAVRIASDLFALAGTAATDEKHNLHRHWRNARTLTLHDPARWKYHHVGNFVLNAAPPPSRSLI
jgi:SfnB family sulfur acquisition oxidoreductase